MESCSLTALEIKYNLMLEEVVNLINFLSRLIHFWDLLMRDPVLCLAILSIRNLFFSIN